MHLLIHKAGEGDIGISGERTEEHQRRSQDGGRDADPLFLGNEQNCSRPGWHEGFIGCSTPRPLLYLDPYLLQSCNPALLLPAVLQFCTPAILKCKAYIATI